MENTSGFYKKDENGEWFYAPNFVYGPNYSLTKEEKDTYQMPIEGWQWHDEAPQEYLHKNL